MTTAVSDDNKDKKIFYTLTKVNSVKIAPNGYGNVSDKNLTKSDSKKAKGDSSKILKEIEDDSRNRNNHSNPNKRQSSKSNSKKGLIGQALADVNDQKNIKSNNNGGNINSNTNEKSNKSVKKNKSNKSNEKNINNNKNNNRNEIIEALKQKYIQSKNNAKNNNYNNNKTNNNKTKKKDNFQKTNEEFMMEILSSQPNDDKKLHKKKNNMGLEVDDDLDNLNHAVLTSPNKKKYKLEHPSPTHQFSKKIIAVTEQFMKDDDDQFKLDLVHHKMRSTAIERIKDLDERPKLRNNVIRVLSKQGEVDNINTQSKSNNLRSGTHNTQSSKTNSKENIFAGVEAGKSTEIKINKDNHYKESFITVIDPKKEFVLSPQMTKSTFHRKKKNGKEEFEVIQPLSPVKTFRIDIKELQKDIVQKRILESNLSPTKAISPVSYVKSNKNNKKDWESKEDVKDVKMKNLDNMLQVNSFRDSITFLSQSRILLTKNSNNIEESKEGRNIRDVGSYGGNEGVKSAESNSKKRIGNKERKGKTFSQSSHTNTNNTINNTLNNNSRESSKEKVVVTGNKVTVDTETSSKNSTGNINNLNNLNNNSNLNKSLIKNLTLPNNNNINNNDNINYNRDNIKVHENNNQNIINKNPTHQPNQTNQTNTQQQPTTQ